MSVEHVGGATLAEALVAFHGEAPVIVKDSVNPHFKSKFASLDAIMASVRPVLTRHGLAISQHPTALESGMPALRTILLHTSGDKYQDIMPLAVDKPGPQALGSALTYARRYAVLAVLGLVADEDDDANTAQKASEQVAPVEGVERSSPSAPSTNVGSVPAGAATPDRTTDDRPATQPQRDLLAKLGVELLKAGKITEERAAKADEYASDPKITRGKIGVALDILLAVQKGEK